MIKLQFYHMLYQNIASMNDVHLTCPWYEKQVRSHSLISMGLREEHEPEKISAQVKSREAPIRRSYQLSSYRLDLKVLACIIDIRTD